MGQKLAAAWEAFKQPFHAIFSIFAILLAFLTGRASVGELMI